MLGNTTNDIRRQLGEARTTRERLYGEIENLKARADADDDGIAQRIADTNRVLAKADDRITDMQGEPERFETSSESRPTRSIRSGEPSSRRRTVAAMGRDQKHGMRRRT